MEWLNGKGKTHSPVLKAPDQPFVHSKCQLFGKKGLHIHVGQFGSPLAVSNRSPISSLFAHAHAHTRIQGQNKNGANYVNGTKQNGECRFGD